jgi:hypothetical protein
MVRFPANSWVIQHPVVNNLFWSGPNQAPTWVFDIRDAHLIPDAEKQSFRFMPKEGRWVRAADLEKKL